jgi:hypothetical protein
MCRNFYFAGLKIRINGVGIAQRNCSLRGNDVFRTELLRAVVCVGILAFIKDELRYSVTIAEMDEDQAAEIATPMNPAHQDRGSAGIACPQLSTGMSTSKVAE